MPETRTATRIAMWSGPRNISTAMMRSWENRPDCVVCDEPLYAHYLVQTGIQHPGRDEVLARHEADWQRVVAGLIGPIPDGKAVYYQKHMAHHLLPNIRREWLTALRHCFLIRDPQDMLTSLIDKWPDPVIDDTGLPQQIEILEYLREHTGQTPVIVDSRDVLERPGPMLERLCGELGVPFTEAMLRWPAGPRDSDGVWAPYWYAAVHASTGFAPYRPKNAKVPPQKKALLDECMGYYEQLYPQRLNV